MPFTPPAKATLPLAIILGLAACSHHDSSSSSSQPTNTQQQPAVPLRFRPHPSQPGDRTPPPSEPRADG